MPKPQLSMNACLGLPNLSEGSLPTGAEAAAVNFTLKWLYNDAYSRVGSAVIVLERPSSCQGIGIASRPLMHCIRAQDMPEMHASDERHDHRDSDLNLELAGG